MGYVVVVFAIINTAALGLVALFLMNLTGDIPAIVETVIQDEVRKQDDRIEKRRQRAEGPAEDAPETLRDGTARLQPGRPYNR